MGCPETKGEQLVKSLQSIVRVPSQWMLPLSWNERHHGDITETPLIMCQNTNHLLTQQFPTPTPKLPPMSMQQVVPIPMVTMMCKNKCCKATFCPLALSFLQRHFTPTFQGQSWSSFRVSRSTQKLEHSSFRRPCFQRGEVREKSQFPAGATFPPEIWQKDLIEPACLAYVPTLDTFKVGDIEGPARKFRTQAELSRGKNHAQKTMTTHENLLSLAADSGVDANKNHNNQPYKHFHTYLGRVSLHFWVDWAAVALTVSLLIRGPFSRTRTQVDCFDLYFLIQ